MEWLRRIFRGHSVDPEEYQKVPCELCHGTGLPAWDRDPTLRGTNFDRVAFNRGGRCPMCHGKGWHYLGGFR